MRLVHIPAFVPRLFRMLPVFAMLVSGVGALPPQTPREQSSAFVDRSLAAQAGVANMIVTGRDADDAAAAVRRVGGTVTSDLCGMCQAA